MTWHTDDRSDARTAPCSITLPGPAADRIYRGVATAGGLVTLVVLFLIGLFLFLRSASTFRQYGM